MYVVRVVLQVDNLGRYCNLYTVRYLTVDRRVDRVAKQAQANACQPPPTAPCASTLTITQRNP